MALRKPVPDLDRRITLIEPGAETSDHLGAPVRGPDIEHAAWAQRRDFTGRERFAAGAGAEISGEHTRFLIRWRRVGSDWRVRDEQGRSYDIGGVAEVAGRRRYLELLAVREP